MALMFPRLAHNFAKNGYYPTDEATLERILNALDAPYNQRVRILDPCAGEGMAILEPRTVWDGREPMLMALSSIMSAPGTCNALWMLASSLT